MTAERASPRPLRADAARNHARILQAARIVFGMKGLDVSLDEIAHQAGVGVATLYRRFPDRQSLVVALFELELSKTVDLAKAALAADDPWEGFTGLLKSIFATVATDKGMRQALIGARHGLSAATPNKVELIRLLSSIIQRAQESRRLRDGITARDIPVLILMVSAAADFGAGANPRIWERYSALLIDGLSAPDISQPLVPDAMSEREMAFAASLW